MTKDNCKWCNTKLKDNYAEIEHSAHRGKIHKRKTIKICLDCNAHFENKLEGIELTQKILGAGNT